MVPGEILCVESSQSHQRNGKGIAHGERHGSAIGWSQVKRVSLSCNDTQKYSIALLRQRRARVASHGDGLGPDTPHGCDQSDQLFGLAAVGDSNHDIIRSDHT